LVERHVSVSQQVSWARTVADRDTDAGIDYQGHRHTIENERLTHDF